VPLDQVCDIFLSLVLPDELEYGLGLANVCIWSLEYGFQGKMDCSLPGGGFLPAIAVTAEWKWSVEAGPCVLPEDFTEHASRRGM
jgi:hypothetical protein